MEPSYCGKGLTTSVCIHRMDLSSKELPLFPGSGGPEVVPTEVEEGVPPITEEIPSLTFATQTQASVNDHQSEEDEDIAFAAEAAANAVEEADAEQQRLDQSLMTCRVCGQGGVDGRPLLHFLPMDPAIVLVTSQALPPSSPIPSTFSDHICLHIFCGKTASILPSVCRPELEILAKAGLKNKHGIGAEVNAALARTRAATLLSMPENTDALANKHDKQFYLAKEFEAHLAAIRICAASILDSRDNDVQAMPPPEKASPKQVARKRKRARSITSSHGQLWVSLSSKDVPATMPLQNGQTVTTTSMENTMEIPAINMQQMHLRIISAQNGLAEPTNNERTSNHGNAGIAQPEMLRRPPSLMPQIIAPSECLLNQQSSLLMFSDQTVLQHQSNSEVISSGQGELHERQPNMRAVGFPPQVPDVSISSANDAKKKSNNFWNRRATCSAKVDSSPETHTSLSPPNHPVYLTAPNLLRTSSREVRCDCGGTFQLEADANGVLGWQSHFSTSQHQQWMEDRTHGTGEQ